MFLLLLYIGIALFFSFFCSLAEAVLLSSSEAFVAHSVRRGTWWGPLLKKQKEDVNRPLAAILSLNTIAHTVGAAGAGAQAASVYGSQYMGYFSAVLTFLILVISEIIPKTVGAVYWRSLAPGVAVGLRYLTIMLYPLVLMSEWLTRRISGDTKIRGMSRDEFMAMVELGRKEGQLEAKESRILTNLFRFRSFRARDVLTPRTVVFGLPKEMTIGEVYANHAQMRFSRIPIYGEDLDSIAGFVLKDTILELQVKKQWDVKLSEISREMTALPASVSLWEIFNQFMQKREHIALVVDEYGGLEGIVTLEDVVETLLGLEIVDEADSSVDMQALARKLWRTRARKMGILKPDNEENGPHGSEVPKEGSKS